MKGLCKFFISLFIRLFNSNKEKSKFQHTDIARPTYVKNNLSEFDKNINRLNEMLETVNFTSENFGSAAQTVAELESMIHSQNSLMEKLTGECRLLTDKLDDANRRHKYDMFYN